MDIEAIYPPHIYSVRYDGRNLNEFDRLFTEWNDVESILKFLEQNREFLRVGVWKHISEPASAARQVLDEAGALEQLFDELAERTSLGEQPDFDAHFRYLEGKYKYELEYTPMKSYGPITPSLLRMYAIKISSNTYLITGGGIKLADTIQHSPGLREHVLQDIDRVRDWLKANGVIDNEDFED